ncbi:MAG: ImmA/IrrE family metallo-endopeptidase [Oscillospiraceae bacterium]|nr:ImmA/IrrE family metallo-endopeptidase [Oscillospiraceae bacterium]
MTTLTTLYDQAKQQNIEILSYPLPLTGSMALELEDGRCYIGMDYDALEDERDRLVHLAHEMGHCVRGAFYNRYAKMDLRQRHENTADKWAIRKLIPMEDLDDAIAAGYTEMWELAEHFNVTVEFMRKAVCLYTHGNLEADLYF